MLVLLGCSANASAIVTADQHSLHHLSYSIGWSLAVYFGILICVKTSGAHLNPAVTLTLAVFEKFPWAQVPIYLLAQFVGSFFAAWIVLINASDAIENYS